VQLTRENPGFRYTIRAVDAAGVTVDDRRLERSFFLTAETLVEDWAASDPAALEPADLEPLLALKPDVVLLGTGPRLRFPPPAVMAACLARGIGLEAMDNAAAARTFTVLAGEGRRVVAGFLL
jgi:uncharacterized protein